MPLYEYQCESCAKRFERIQRYSDPPIEICPSCGSHVKKLMSSPAIQFKGSGFYINDYAKKSQSDAGKSESDSAKRQTDKTDKAATKSDSSPAAGDSGSSAPATTTTTTSSDTSTSSNTKKE